MNPVEEVHKCSEGSVHQSSSALNDGEGSPVNSSASSPLERSELSLCGAHSSSKSLPIHRPHSPTNHSQTASSSPSDPSLLIKTLTLNHQYFDPNTTRPHSSSLSLSPQTYEETTQKSAMGDDTTTVGVDEYSSESDNESSRKKKEDTKRPNADGINWMKNLVLEEWRKYGFITQTKRDAEMWAQTLACPGSEARGNVLRRIMAVLRWGGLFYRQKAVAFDKRKQNEESQEYQFKNWSDTTWPICTALSHGGRIVIQLPKSTNKGDKSSHDFSFWNWLITGDKKGDIAKLVTTSTSGDHCLKKGKVVFKRLSATHGLEFEENEIPIMGEAKKVLIEQKTKGFSLRDTKMLRSSEYTLRHHRHWGMNIPMGGEGQMLLTGVKSTANGSNGHLYLYHMAPKHDSYGGVMIGLEGSEYGKFDQTGEYHGVSAKSSAFSPTFGFKWHSKEHLDLTSVKGPGKYDCMYIDLTSGWDYIVEKFEQEWKDEMVKETSLRAPNNPIVATRKFSFKFSVINIKSTQRAKKWRAAVKQRHELPDALSHKDMIVQSSKTTKFF
ncbi:hypothetical protein FDP41_009687 [Naegleria fowleri]|uniref:Novel toxin 11 domain-containing protein n=1 Tax=Naegleria fowleri TaxID=5763 RepID=A0A6A5BAW7_NAEFO|nr:uncharacterized protein FDP41_009687 [Naegleria fowleri]KAF0971991.1 hypothetical protein FDP41_009687 [Naegleria fowleri]